MSRGSHSGGVGAPQVLVRDMEILNKFGIHARPAALFVKTAGQFDCEITVENNGTSVSGKSIMGLLTLESPKGTVLRVAAKGADAKEALAALGQLVASKFYED